MRLTLFLAAMHALIKYRQGWNILSLKKRIAIVLIMAVVTSLVSIHFYFRCHPEGIYFDPGTDIYTFWIFDGGQYCRQMTLSEFQPPHEMPKTAANYSWNDSAWEEHGAWDCGSFSMRASIFGATFMTEHTYLHPRRFLPRLWVVKVERYFRFGRYRYVHI